MRSDEVRKRLWGAGPLDRLPGEAYAPQIGVRVYEQMFGEAEACLAAGRAVILDAVFLKASEREAAEAVARKAGVRFVGRWLEAPADLLRDRIAGRTGDASDADEAILAKQLALDAGPLGWTRVDARADFETSTELLVKSVNATFTG